MHNAAPEVSKPAGSVLRRGGTLRLQVGLDFGTSNTKVMYQVRGAPRREVSLLRFEGSDGSQPDYCLPSLGAFDDKGELLFGNVAARRLSRDAWGSGLTGFKMLAAGEADSRYLDTEALARYREYLWRMVGDEGACPPAALAAAYLAYVMRLTRQRLEREFKPSALDLWFNTCVPIDQRENNAVADTFERIIAVAQEVEHVRPSSEEPGREWLMHAREKWDSTTYHGGNEATRIWIVPEAVAGVAGYTNSLRRRAGIHALIDIGAGTTDVSIFQLSVSRRGEPTLYWYAARSIPYGIARIKERIADELRGEAREAARSAIDATLDGRDTSRAAIVQRGLREIWKLSLRAWAEAYAHLAKESAWRGNNVHVFLSGGGALIPTARSEFARAFIPRWGPYPCDLVSAPDAYPANYAASAFPRLCVAYGLTTPVPELVEYVMPADSPNHTPPKVSVQDDDWGGDQLVPRPGWV